MNIRLNTAHMETLCKLNELAKKHNCVINFGLNNNSDTDLDQDLLTEKGGLSKKLLNEFMSLDLENTYSQNSKYYFTLYDKNNKSYHSLSYNEAMTSCFYDEDNINSEELLNWLEEYSHEDWLSRNFFSFSKEYQTIFGFDNIDKTNINVYREGMLLKFFGDLVCDYLGEERIQEVY